MSGMVIVNSASGVIVRNNPGSSVSGSTPGSLFNIPPNAPLDMGELATLFASADAQNTPPSEAAEGDIYLDDGTNTTSGARGFRQYSGGEWVDLGLQEVTDVAIDGGEWT